MSISTLINRTCHLHLRDESGTLDDYGNDLPSVTVTATVCEIQPRRANEDDNQGELSDDDYVAYFIPGTDLSTADAVVVAGETFELVGKPPVWRSPRTGENVYVAAYVRRTAGSEDAS